MANLQPTPDMWKAAEKHCQEVKAEYDKLVTTKGVNVTFALHEINKLLTLYANGSQTAQLYIEMMNVS